MTTLFIILALLFVLIVGLIKVARHYKRIVKNLEFASEYRNKFVEFANKYFKDYDRFSRSGNLDSELYIWLTKNVSRIQSNLGSMGVMDYLAPFQTYKVSNYQIIINTIPKFRDGHVQDFDVNSVDDCLLRYIGYTEEREEASKRNLTNPLIWFRIGFQEVMSLPLFILNWFGIFSGRTVDRIMESTFYKIVSGIFALVAFASGVVTIIVGKEQTVEFIRRVLGK